MNEIESSSVVVCPECGVDAPYMNIGKTHFGVCEACKVIWPVGSNLFSDWKDENDLDWAVNESRVVGYRLVA